MSPRDPYRCEKCVDEVNRCVRCRARRQKRKQELQADKRAAGICIDCRTKAEPGSSRCKKHRKMNNALSSAAHKRARKSAS